MNSRFNIIKGNKEKCFYCGQEEKCTSDHFFPKSRGGRIRVYACGLCQRTKENMTPQEWIVYISKHVAFKKSIRKRIINATKSLLAVLREENESLIYNKNERK